MCFGHRWWSSGRIGTVFHAYVKRDFPSLTQISSDQRLFGDLEIMKLWMDVMRDLESVMDDHERLLDA